jgi:hypothetical protein
MRFSACVCLLGLHSFDIRNSSNICIIHLSLIIIVHTKKRNTFVNGSIVTADYNQYENKFVRPYFLIHPQTVLMLPNETGKLIEIYSRDKNRDFILAKFKCCFGGDPLPNLIWSHNESRVPEILAAGGKTSTRYRLHKLHDIYYLDIGPVNLRDNGQIKCTIMNRLGREDAVAQLIVARKDIQKKID